MDYNSIEARHQRLAQLKEELAKDKRKKQKRDRLEGIMVQEKIDRLKNENAILRELLQTGKKYLEKAKNINPITKPMTTADFELWLDGVSLSKDEHIESLKKQFLDLLERREKLKNYKNQNLAEKKLAINSLAIESVLSDIEAYENGEGVIRFPY